MLTYALLGVGAGAVYALLGQGIVLIYRGSGVLNLAHGALAMLSAFVFGLLRADQGWSSWAAGAVAVAGTAAIGLVIDGVILRVLREVSALARLIATLGVFLVIYASATLAWGTDAPLVFPIFPSSPVTIAGATLRQDTFWTLGVAVVLTIALTAIWRYTRLGWLAEAVAENERSAASLGWSPQVVSSATWVAGAALAGFAGVLIAPIAQLNVDSLSLLVIPALAAAIIGGFRSFPMTLAGGVVVGVAQSITANYVDLTGAADALPFLLIIVVMTVRGSSLPQRGHVFDRLPSVGSGRVSLGWLTAAVLGGAAVIVLIDSSQWLAAIAGTFGAGTILLSLVVLVGYAGQVSLAQFALAGLGGLISVHLCGGAGWSFPLACVAGVLAASAVGVLFSLPALRTRGVNLAVVTLGLGVATQAMIFNNTDLTGALAGLDVGSTTLFGWDLDAIDHSGRYALACFVLFVCSACVVANLRRGRTGRRLLAVRANERSAAAAGISVWGAKLYAFAVAGGLAGLGGNMLAFSASTATFAGYNPISSISAVANAMIGGIGYVVGALAGALLSSQSFGSVIAVNIDSIDSYLPLIGGIAVLATLMAAPNGQMPQFIGVLSRLRRLLPARHRADDGPLPKTDPVKVVPRGLSVDGVTVRYGSIAAVTDVTLTVEPGEVVGLIGPNGAGKTSFMDAVTGFTPCMGQVRVGGSDVSGWSPARRAQGGMTRSFQGLELFDDMTVLENLQAASEPRSLWAYLTDLVRPGRPPLTAAAVAALHEFDLQGCLHQRPTELSYGQRRLVAIARACAAAPSVLLLDEPVAGLDDDQSAECAALVRRLATSWGMAILVIEHDMNFVMGLCDRLVVMEFGHQIAAGTPSAISCDPVALRAYLGGEADDGPSPAPLQAEAVASR